MQRWSVQRGCSRYAAAPAIVSVTCAHVRQAPMAGRCGCVGQAPAIVIHQQGERRRGIAECERDIVSAWRNAFCSASRAMKMILKATSARKARRVPSTRLVNVMPYCSLSKCLNGAVPTARRVLPSRWHARVPACGPAGGAVRIGGGQLVVGALEQHQQCLHRLRQGAAGRETDVTTSVSDLTLGLSVTDSGLCKVPEVGLQHCRVFSTLSRDLCGTRSQPDPRKWNSSIGNA